MKTYNQKTFVVIAVAVGLTGCGRGTEPTRNAAISAAPLERVRTCETIIEDVIAVAAKNGVTIVKIYDPKTIKADATKVACSGRALVGSGQSGTIYYRDFKDKDGDWLVEYAEKPLE